MIQILFSHLKIKFTLFLGTYFVFCNNVQIIRNEIQKEKLKNNNSNNLIDDSDIDEDGITEDDLVLK